MKKLLLAGFMSFGFAMNGVEQGGLKDKQQQCAFDAIYNIKQGRETDYATILKCYNAPSIKELSKAQFAEIIEHIIESDDPYNIKYLISFDMGGDGQRKQNRYNLLK